MSEAHGETSPFWVSTCMSLGGLVALLLLLLPCVSLRGRWCRTALLATAINFLWLAGATVDLKWMGYATAALTAACGVAVAIYVPLDLIRRRSNFLRLNHSDDTAERPLLASTRYRDVTTSLVEVCMIFSGQMMLLVLYIHRLCTHKATHDPPVKFSPDLWLAGWVAQFMVYTQFGFNFQAEWKYWRYLMSMSLGCVFVKKEGVEKEMVIDWRELLFRSSLAFLSQGICRVFIWMSLPIYFAMSVGDSMDVLREVAAMMFIACISDAPFPVEIRACSALFGEGEGSGADMPLIDKTTDDEVNLETGHSL
eukprot:TRINITY_DN37732_c0_g1_i1.p1 TRINITY_DN37732_c0_g1~~TRINITY_DN37732_c0_g1_i1.p1  ORF type:complete len:335 (+),score=44.43 TRINITY_DN37732_c0_g1_i1:81-1007(+)